MSKFLALGWFTIWFTEMEKTTGRTRKKTDGRRRPFPVQSKSSFWCDIFEIPVTQSSDDANRQLDMQVGSSRLEIYNLNLAAYPWYWSYSQHGLRHTCYFHHHLYHRLIVVVLKLHGSYKSSGELIKISIPGPQPQRFWLGMQVLNWT